MTQEGFEAINQELKINEQKFKQNPSQIQQLENSINLKNQQSINDQQEELNVQRNEELDNNLQENAIDPNILIQMPANTRHLFTIQQILQDLTPREYLESQFFCLRKYKYCIEPIYFNIIQLPYCEWIWGIWYVFFGWWRFIKLGFHSFAIDYLNFYLWMVFFFGYDEHSFFSSFKLQKLLYFLINVDYFVLWPSYLFIGYRFFKDGIPKIMQLYEIKQNKKRFMKLIRKIEYKKKRYSQYKQNKKQTKQQQKQQQQQGVCAICLGQYSTNILPCKHIYHKQCIQQWLKEHNKCPICRVELF